MGTGEESQAGQHVGGSEADTGTSADTETSGEPGNGRDPGSPELDQLDVKYAQSVGKVTAPLLAGFSFTAVVIVAEDPERFYLADAAILSLTVAVILLIATVQCSKYVRRKDPERFRRLVGYYGGTLISYRSGLVALLLGLGFALAPLQMKGVPTAPRWVASSLAWAAAVAQFFAYFFGRHNWIVGGKSLFSGKYVSATEKPTGSEQSR